MTQTTKVSLRGLYKIFGNDDKSVLPHVKAGMGKEELLTTHKHIGATPGILLNLVGNFQKISIRVTDIKRDNWTKRPTALDRPI